MWRMNEGRLTVKESGWKSILQSLPHNDNLARSSLFLTSHYYWKTDSWRRSISLALVLLFTWACIINTISKQLFLCEDLCKPFIFVCGLPLWLSCNAGDLGSISGLGRSPGEGKGYPLQYSCLENSTDCIVHGVAKRQTWLNDFHFTLQSLHPTLFLCPRHCCILSSWSWI